MLALTSRSISAGSATGGSAGRDTTWTVRAWGGQLHSSVTPTR
jgi:hypothetical protein